MDKDAVYTTPAGAQLLLPKGTKVRGRPGKGRWSGALARALRKTERPQVVLQPPRAPALPPTSPPCQVDHVGHKFSSPCADYALVRLSLPAPAPAGGAGGTSSGAASGSAPPAGFQLAYLKMACLGYDPTLNK